MLEIPSVLKFNPFFCSTKDLGSQNTTLQALSRSGILEDKGGVTITGSGDFGDLEVESVANITFTVT